MKKSLKRALPVFLIILTAAAAVAISLAYYGFISAKIFEDSSVHLDEIYSQVNRSFSEFVNRHRELLESFGDYIGMSSGDPSAASDFAENKRQYWGFSDLYLVLRDGGCISADGEREQLGLAPQDFEGLGENELVISGASLSDGSEVTVFAMPIKPGNLDGFEYFAAAISYTNADLAESLKINAFEGKAKCFVIYGDGSVLISTTAGGNIYGNYLTYLKGASDLTESELEKLKSDWSGEASGLKRCKIGGERQFLIYRPVEYQELVLLSIVPESVVIAGFSAVQRITLFVIGAMFLLVFTSLVILIVNSFGRRFKQSRTELKYRELMFDVLSKSVDDIFIMIDSRGNAVDYISPNVERLLGIPYAEAKRNIRAIEKCTVGYDDLVTPENEIDAVPVQGSKSWECEYVHQLTGERRWYRGTIYSMSVSDTKKYIVVMSDRTKEQQMTQKLTEALNAARSANEAKSNFLSNMSHDIRTPMNAIVGFSVLLEKDADKPEKVKEYTRKITASGHHLLSLINDVLDMSKIESGKTSLNTDTFSLPELLDDIGIIISPQAKAKNQDFKISVEGAPPEKLLGDRLRLNQIIINLLSNAVKYTPADGKIDFTVSELPPPAPNYAKLRFTVKDNGIGMSEEFVSQIFAPFSREINSVTNKIQGTGLGMAITKNLVDLMGGIITVDSVLGEGSTFTVELTFALSEVEDAASWLKNRVTRILVADDEEHICLDVKELLSESGIETDIACDGHTAFNLAEKAYLAGRGYDVILLDWKMPGLDGVETARKIRDSIGKKVPILVLSSYDWSDIEEEARSAGINAFMPKPFFVSTLCEVLRPLYSDRPAPPPKKQPEQEEENLLDGRLFLVAEDNDLNAEILTEMLKMDGAECELAKNGREALDMFAASPEGKYDMILMDVQMPQMNGYEATRAIRSLDRPDAKTIPIAAMTANTFAEDVKNALEAGMNAHLAKPIDIAAMKKLLSELLREADKKEGKNV